MIITPAKRTLSVKPYYFSVKNPEIAALSAERVARGEDPVINLGIGSPDRMPPQEAIDELCHTISTRITGACPSFAKLSPSGMNATTASR